MKMTERWLQIWNFMRFSRPSQTSLRAKAIAVAERVTTLKKGENSKVSCPVCLDVIQAGNDDDLKMTLAVHMSLWHPDDVILQWDIMHNKEQSGIHMPSFIVGVGIAAGFGVLLVLSAKNQHRELPVSRRRR